MKRKKVSGKKAKVSGKKAVALAQLVDTFSKSRTIALALIEGISASQLQQIKQKLSERATITITKKSLLLRALEQVKSSKPAIAELERWLERPFALIITQLEPFELASLLAELRFPAKAKAGQIAPDDIMIEPGPTELPAGPAISHLGALGIKTSIEAGKISIKEKKVLVRKNEPISADVASILTKLEITPFMLGLDLLVAYDSKENKVYAEIKIDKEAIAAQLKELASKALVLSLHINYATSETIKLLLSKAHQESSALSGLIK